MMKKKKKTPGSPAPKSTSTADVKVDIEVGIPELGAQLKSLRSGAEPAEVCTENEKEAIRKTSIGLRPVFGVAALAAKEENQLVESSRLYGSVNELIFAAASDIALGLEELLGHSKSSSPP